jgi:hypothetical protein
MVAELKFSDGSRAIAPARDKPLWRHERGLSYTASGYGSRIPTRHMVQWEGRWRRVYCAVWSNIGTAYLLGRAGEWLATVEEIG